MCCVWYELVAHGEPQIFVPLLRHYLLAPVFLNIQTVWSFPFFTWILEYFWIRWILLKYLAAESGRWAAAATRTATGGSHPRHWVVGQGAAAVQVLRHQRDGGWLRHQAIAHHQLRGTPGAHWSTRRAGAATASTAEAHEEGAEKAENAEAAGAGKGEAGAHQVGLNLRGHLQHCRKKYALGLRIWGLGFSRSKMCSKRWKRLWKRSWTCGCGQSWMITCNG